MSTRFILPARLSAALLLAIGALVVLLLSASRLQAAPQVTAEIPTNLPAAWIRAESEAPTVVPAHPLDRAADFFRAAMAPGPQSAEMPKSSLSSAFAMPAGVLLTLLGVSLGIAGRRPHGRHVRPPAAPAD